VALDTIIYLPEKPTIYVPQYLTISHFRNSVTVSYPNKNTTKNTGFIQLYRIDCTNYSVKRIYLDVKEKGLKGMKPYFSSLAENEKTLVAIGGQYVLIFNKAADDSIYSLQ
jgi:hypothetical protein